MSRDATLYAQKQLAATTFDIVVVNSSDLFATNEASVEMSDNKQHKVGSNYAQKIKPFAGPGYEVYVTMRTKYNGVVNYISSESKRS